MSDLGAAVRFGATIGKLLAETVRIRNDEGQEDQRSGQVIVVDSYIINPGHKNIQVFV